MLRSGDDYNGPCCVMDRVGFHFCKLWTCKSLTFKSIEKLLNQFMNQHVGCVFEVFYEYFVNSIMNTFFHMSSVCQTRRSQLVDGFSKVQVQQKIFLKIVERRIKWYWPNKFVPRREFAPTHKLVLKNCPQRLFHNV
jgi:hypothetical protein